MKAIVSHVGLLLLPPTLDALFHFRVSAPVILPAWNMLILTFHMTSAFSFRSKLPHHFHREPVTDHFI